MNYENTDWGAEAKRVADAFGIIEPCVFLECGCARYLKGVDGIDPELQDGRLVIVMCNNNCDGFTGWNFAVYKAEEWYADIWISNDGYVDPLCYVRSSTQTVLRALFRLGLLTSEVENVLKVGISAHQKAEWLLEDANIE